MVQEMLCPDLGLHSPTEKVVVSTVVAVEQVHGLADHLIIVVVRQIQQDVCQLTLLKQIGLHEDVP